MSTFDTYQNIIYDSDEESIDPVEESIDSVEENDFDASSDNYNCNYDSDHDYLTADDFNDFCIHTDDPDFYDDFDSCEDIIPTTDAGELAYTIKEDGSEISRVSGHVILNQCGSLLCRSKHQIKGSSKHKFFLQKIHATSPGNSIPLLYPEHMLFLQQLYF